jgi:hypothetical protein
MLLIVSLFWHVADEARSCVLPDNTRDNRLVAPTSIDIRRLNNVRGSRLSRALLRLSSGARGGI